MKKTMQIKRSEKGFTLLEVIITIVIAAILGSFLITFMGTAVTRSSDPIFQAQNIAIAKDKMEKVAAYYAAYGTSTRSTTDWETFKTRASSVGTVVPITAFLVSTFDAIEVTITEKNQTFISYYTS